MTAVALPRAVRVRGALAFAGPAFLVSVGSIDPGNWGRLLAAAVTVAAVLVALNVPGLALLL